MKEYKKITKIAGPLLIVEGVGDVAYDEEVEIFQYPSRTLTGKVLEIENDRAIIQLYDSNQGLDPTKARVRFRGHPVSLQVSSEMIGRIFDGQGKIVDGGANLFHYETRDINGQIMNPVLRDYPEQFIQTGISAIDGLNTLVLGQKLPIFSGSGLPHNELAAQIARQAKVLDEDISFAVVFCAMGISFEESRFFIDELTRTGAIARSVLFINLADDPAIERISTPRMAMTAAEYLAFELDMHVMVIMTDMSHYCEALREVSSSRREVPSRRGFPGYMYTDLAGIYERAGRLKGKAGSITLMPILSMPEDDKTHPIPDLTGYITEGQIILSRDLNKLEYKPPINVLPSLSRLKDKGIGAGKTREDHADTMNQIFAIYSQGISAIELANILGDSALSDLDRKYAAFSRAFDREYINQGFYENRSIEETLDLGWKLLKTLPKSSLKRIRKTHLDKYYQ